MKWAIVAAVVSASFAMEVREPAMAAPVYSIQTFNIPGAFYTYVEGINDAGQIVGTINTSIYANNQAYIYTIATGATTFIQVPGTLYGSDAADINNLGQVVAYDSATYKSYVRDPATGAFTAVGVPEVIGINDAGLVLGQYNANQSMPFTERGLLLDPRSGLYTTLSVLPTANATFPSGINDLGQVVGSFINTDSPNFEEEGFLRDPATGLYTILSDPYGTRGTIVTGINDVGDVVGEYQDSTGTNHGFLLDLASNTYTDLGFLPNAINDAGQIVGVVTDSNGVHGIAGFIATPQATTVPEPAGLLLLGTGLLSYGVVRRAAKHLPSAGSSARDA